MPRSPISIMDLVKAGLVKPGEELRYFGHEELKAKVASRGTLAYDGVEYASPSAAATAVQGVSTNGWKAWHTRGRSKSRTLGEPRAELLDAG